MLGIGPPRVHAGRVFGDGPLDTPGPSPTIAEPGLALAIEMSNPGAEGPGGAGVALGEVGADGAVRPIDAERLAPSSARDDGLVAAIDRLTIRAGREPAELRRVAVSVGPGGYTALRVSVAAAKAISLATGARCVAVPTPAALVEAAAGDLGGASSVAVLLAWKRGACWRHAFERAGASWRAAGTPGVVGLDAAGAGVEAVIAEPRLEASLGGGGAAVVAPRFDAGAVLRVGGLLATIGAAALAPVYAREPEAVRLHERRGRA